jgi:hypothetical protein
MKLLVIILIAIFCIASIELVSAQLGGDYQRMNQYFEYMNPGWRLHRLRIRPYVFANPSPMWRVNGK